MVKKIRLVGCQSWEDSTIELLPDKLNIIKAENNVGKSVLFKMLKISACPKIFNARKRKKLIRWGHSNAQALYEFTDGSIGGVVVYPTKILYLYLPVGSKAWQKSYEPDPRMLENLGLIVSRNSNFIANVIDTDQSLLLVDAEAKSTYDFIKMLCNNAMLDEYAEKLDNVKKEMYSISLDLEVRLNSVRDELAKSRYVDIGAMQLEVDRLVCTKGCMYKLVSVAYGMEDVGKSIDYARDYETLFKILGVLEAVEAIDLRQCMEKKFDAELLEVLSVLEQLDAVDLQSVLVRKEPVSDSVLKLLEQLESVDLSVCAWRKEPVSVEFVDVLNELELCFEDVKRLGESQRLAGQSFERVCNLEKQFVESGVSYNCPVYGRILFDGKECVPYSA